MGKVIPEQKKLPGVVLEGEFVKDYMKLMIDLDKTEKEGVGFLVVEVLHKYKRLQKEGKAVTTNNFRELFFGDNIPSTVSDGNFTDVDGI